MSNIIEMVYVSDLSNEFGIMWETPEMGIIVESSNDGHNDIMPSYDLSDDAVAVICESLGVTLTGVHNDGGINLYMVTR